MAQTAALAALADACCLCRNFRIQNQLSLGVQCDKNYKGGNMDVLICNEVLYKDHQEDDLGLGGLRSLPGKPFIFSHIFSHFFTFDFTLFFICSHFFSQ